MDLTSLTITQTHQGLVKKKFSALELAKAYLNRIKKEDKKIHSFLTVSGKLALSQAREIDKKISKKENIDLLAGIPSAIKDNIMVEDIKCTAASKILESYIASYNATVIEKLEKAGTVILGKTNLDEFAMGSSCENSAFGATKNPCDLKRVTGGSSGGSAAAVAANLCGYALGSDTGGSIRLPASFCGVVGLKPTYGAVSRYGLIAFASSLDQIGPMAKTVEDAKIVFNAIKGWDEMDSTSIKSNHKTQITNQSTKTLCSAEPINMGSGYKQKTKHKLQITNLRIGIPREYFVKGMNEEVEKKIKKAIKKYEEMGAKIIEVSLPHTKYALPVYYIISPSEASANLARYDGIRFGSAKTNSKSQIPNSKLLDTYLENRGQGLGGEVKRRIMLGTYALSAGYYDAYYLKAQKVRTLIKEDFENVFKKVDVLLTPVSPTTAFKIGEKIDDPLAMYLSDIFTISVNLAGLPALSLPCGKVDKLPVGLQIIGKPFEDEKILEIGKTLENFTS